MNDKKILLQINVTANWGSTGRIAEEIGLLAMQHGWESYIAYGRMKNPSKSKLIKIGSQWDVYIHYALSRFLDMEGRASKRATRNFLKEIAKIKPSVVHLHNIHDHYLNYPLLFHYLAANEIPVVWTQHDCWNFTGGCGHFVTANCDRWKTECHDCPLRKGYPRSLFFDCSRENYVLKKRLFAGNQNLHLVPVSHWMEGLVRQSFLKDKDIRVIHNGIDLSVFHPYKHHDGERTKIIGVAGVWSRGKGLYDFFELRKMLDRNEYDITLVGLNDEQLKTLPEGICGVKRTDTVEQLAKYYSDADVFVNMTYADTFPTVNIESLGCGTPIITYRTGGSTEIVDEKTGIVVEQGDLKAVVSAIKTVRLLTPEMKDAQRKACRQRAEQNYEAEKSFSEYISLYDRLLGGG